VLQKLQEEGWWEGELNGQVGLFPSNYVRLVEMNTTPASAASNPPAAAAAHSAAVADTTAKPQVPLLLCELRRTARHMMTSHTAMFVCRLLMWKPRRRR
jgi:hypothetical protein